MSSAHSTRAFARSGRALAACLVLAAAPAAQGIAPPKNPNGSFRGGTWVNFESPQVKPLALARLGNAAAPNHYLLVCNTADSTLEIFALNVAGAPQAVARVRVGLDPVSVLWHETNVAGQLSGTIYTANMVGDSVSMIDFREVADVATATLVRTENVGDEPMDMIFDENGGNPRLGVPLNSRGAAAYLDATTLATLAPDPFLPILTQVPFRPTAGGPLQNVDAAMSQPRRNLTAITTHPLTGQPAQFAFVLASRGTHHDFPGTSLANTFSETEIGFDLYWQEMNTSGPPFTGFRKKLGTKNFNMAFDASGACWIVSGDAANRASKTKPNVAFEPTGFLRTLLHLIPSPADPAGAIATRDLNRQTKADGTLGMPVTPSTLSLSHCTDVAVYEKDGTYRVFVTAFNNDALGIIDNVKSGGAWNLSANTWTREFVDLTNAGTPFSGPTSLVVKYASASSPNDPGDRVYVLNRFHNSVTMVDPLSKTIVGNFALQKNPTPAHVAAGREFLYDVGHGNNFNSCASCHFDGRLDGLSWDLSENSNTAPFNLGKISALEEPTWVGQTTFGFTAPKGEFITQSLQGLVNFEVADDFAQNKWFTNKPYHWDMDMANLSDFTGGGFQRLLGGTGLTAAEMATFQDFVNSIHYPPNYEQSPDRRYRGVLGGPNSLVTGSGALRGMKLFHIQPLHTPSGPDREGGRSCVQCHALPEAGDNLGTEAVLTTQLTGNPPPARLPLESSPLRGIAQKECTWRPFAAGSAGRATGSAIDWTRFSVANNLFGAALHFADPASPVGLLPMSAISHDGSNEDMNDFIGQFFSNLGQTERDELTQFVREFDTGVAPSIGRVRTVMGPGSTPSVVADLMEQVRVVNAGLAVTGRIAGAARGFWFDSFPAGTGSFRDVGTGASLTPTALFALLTAADDTLVFQSTPLGMDRRLAVVVPPFVAPVGPPPSGLQLESMVPNTAYEAVPSIQRNWDPTHSITSWRFVWTGALTVGGPVMTEPWDPKALRLMQRGYLGAGDRRHEPARRLRVSGANIRHGAVLTLRVHRSLPPTSDALLLELPIYPSDKLGSTGNRIWETAVEADPIIAAMLALGGYWAPGIDPNSATSVLRRTVVDAINEATFDPSMHFRAAMWNNYTIDVTNDDGTAASATNQQVTIEPPGFVH